MKFEAGFHRITSECKGAVGGSWSESDEYEGPSVNHKNEKVREMCERGKRVTTGVVMGSPVMVRAPFIQKTRASG